MKKSLAILIVGSTLVAAAYAQTTVSSANIVGYQQISKPAGGLQLMGMNWQDSTLTNLVNIDLFTGNANVNLADKLITWNPVSQTYVKYALFSDVPYGGSTTEWRSFTNFFGPAVNPVIPAGSALWVTSPNAPSNETIIVSGNAVLDQYFTNSIVTGLQMLSTPFSSDITLSNLNFIASGATGNANVNLADKITIWDETAQTYVKYALFSDVPYGGSTTEWRSFTNFFGVAVNPTINLGKGFWYAAQSNFTWIVENPYFNNL